MPVRKKELSAGSLLFVGSIIVMVADALVVPTVAVRRLVFVLSYFRS